jgi:hypothetical protein
VTKIVDALNGETSFTYDLIGDRLSVKDAENRIWSFLSKVSASVERHIEGRSSDLLPLPHGRRLRI